MYNVSVIIPTYNRKAFLTNAIDSVLSQTYQNLELIIIDDGSSDKSIEYIKKKLLDIDIFDKDRLQEIDDNIRLEISNLAEKATNSKPVSEDELYTDVLCEDKYE